MSERRLFLVLVDLLIVIAASVIAFAIWSVRGEIPFGELVRAQFQWFAVLAGLWLLFEYASGLYDLRVVIDRDATTRALIQAFLLVLLAYVGIFFALTDPGLLPLLPRGIVVYHGIVAVILMAVWRGAYIRFAHATPFRQRALIVGAGKAGRTIAQTIAQEFQAHYDLVGFIDDDPGKRGMIIDNLRVLGGRCELTTLVKQHRIAEIILAVSHDLSDELFRAIMDAKELGVQITPMPVLYEQITGRVPVQHIGESWYVALPLNQTATGNLASAVKRAFDLVAASIGLIGFGALLPFIVLAIRLDSPGAVFYSQTRVGQGGKLFRVRKLRTMIANAEANGQAQWAVKNDPRITRVGKFLRRTHIDELPQLWNILRGEMSLVGPRPERPEFVAQLEKQIPFYRLRHAVKPGIAGWAVIKAGYVDSIDDARLRVEYDLYYIKHQSIWLDLWILTHTVGQVLMFRGQ